MRGCFRFKISSLLVAITMVVSACGASTTAPPPPATQPTNSPAPDPTPVAAKQKTAEDLYPIAKTEGELNLFTTSTQTQVETSLQRFQAKYPGIKVNIYQLKPSLMNERILADETRRQPVADIIQHSDVAGVTALREKELLANYSPASAAKFPASTTTMAPYAWPDRLGVATILYNSSDMTAEDLKVLKMQGYQGMADPRFRGRIGITDPNILASALTWFWDMSAQMGPDGYTKWLQGLKANRIRMFDSNVPAANAVISGEVDMVLVYEQFSAQAIAKKAPVDVLFPAKTPAFFATSSIAAKAPHPNAARLFMEWFMGVEGQTEWLKVYQVAVPNPDVKDDRPITLSPNFKPLSSGEYHFVTTWKELDAARDSFLKQLNDLLGMK